MIALLFAIAGILAQPTTPPPAFVDEVLRGCRPIVLPGTFVGCEATSDDGDETLFAGLEWEPDGPMLVTGP